MKKILLFLFRKSSQIIYKIVGPERSTILSQSKIGKKVVQLFISKKNNIYMATDGIKLVLSPSEALASGIIHLGEINPLETKLLKKILHNGDVFIDIGAYVDGWHSLIAGKIVGNEGRVYAFEPVPEYYVKLSRNVSINKFRNIIVEKIALSDKNGKQSFYIGGLASTFFKTHLKNEKDIKSVKVVTITLDSYIKKKDIKKIKLIKIDAEGAEMNVINGAKSTFRKKDAPDLMVEVSDVYLQHGNASEDELLTELKNMGYKAYSITEKGLGRYSKKSEGRELMNVYFSKRPTKELPLYN